MAYWKMRPLLMQRKRKFENGFHKMGMKQKWPRTQGSEKILRKISEGRLRSLGK